MHNTFQILFYATLKVTDSLKSIVSAFHIKIPLAVFIKASVNIYIILEKGFHGPFSYENQMFFPKICELCKSNVLESQKLEKSYHNGPSLVKSGTSILHFISQGKCKIKALHATSNNKTY